VAVDTDQVKSRLEELGVPVDVIEKIKTDLGASTVEDLAGLTEDDLVAAGMKKLPARKLVSALAPARPASETAAVAVSFDAVLPAVPSDSSWLEALKAGGVLKVDQSSVISAVRAALASRVGLFDVLNLLVKAMERFADENDEQVDPAFFKLRRDMTRRNYAEIFEALEGFDGNYVTETRRKQLLGRVDEHLWPAIAAFFEQLRSWQSAWMQGAANPAMMMSVLMASSGGGNVIPPGMISPPETGVLRDHADAVADAINRVFAGTGVQIAAALAYDAVKVKEALENPRLPGMIGAANREQMLKQLGVAVSATYPRLENNLTRFVLSIMGVKDQPAGNEELQYFGALYMLGSQIPWDQLSNSYAGGRMPSGIGADRKGRI